MDEQQQRSSELLMPEAQLESAKENSFNVRSTIRRHPRRPTFGSKTNQTHPELQSDAEQVEDTQRDHYQGINPFADSNDVSGVDHADSLGFGTVPDLDVGPDNMFVDIIDDHQTVCCRGASALQCYTYSHLKRTMYVECNQAVAIFTVIFKRR